LCDDDSRTRFEGFEGGGLFGYLGLGGRFFVVDRGPSWGFCSGSLFLGECEQDVYWGASYIHGSDSGV
jgi:hypothetical protein